MKPTVTAERDTLLNPKQAAALLPETTYQTILRWAREGRVPAVRMPSGRVYFRRDDIDALLEPLPVTPAHGIPVNDDETEDVALFERAV